MFIKRIRFVLAVSILPIIILCSCKPKEADNAITLHRYVGTVTILGPEGTKTPSGGDILTSSDAVTTAANSLADILIGRRGVVRVDEKTTLKISMIADNANLELSNGEIFVTLSKLKKGEFKVVTPTAVASIRGTSFRVYATANASRVDVVSGTVKINPVKDNVVIESVEAVVEPNQTAAIDTEFVEKAAVAIEKKKQIEIPVKELPQEDAKKIKETILSIEPAAIEKLDQEVKTEIKEIAEPPKPAQEEKDKLEKEKLEKEKEEKARRQAEEARRRLMTQQQNKQRLETEKKREAERLEQERLEKERMEKERLEKERKERERKDKERREAINPTPL